jgi:hypothetical protein
LEGPWHGPSVLVELPVGIGRAYRALAVENAYGLAARQVVDAGEIIPVLPPVQGAILIAVCGDRLVPS